MIDSALEWTASLFDIFKIGTTGKRCGDCGAKLFINAAESTYCCECTERRRRSYDASRGTHNPLKPPKPCLESGCEELVQWPRRRCQPHAVAHRRTYARLYARGWKARNTKGRAA